MRLRVVGLSSGVLVVAAAIAGVGGLRLQPGSAAGAAPVTSLESRDTGPAGAVAPDGAEPSLNADGRFVTFESSGNLGGLNPGASGQPGPVQIWLRDRTLATTVLISRATGASGLASNQTSGGASVSADGRFVVFDAASTNLIAGYTGRTTTCTGAAGGSAGDVYLRDTRLNTTTLISHQVGVPGTPGNGVSNDPRVSADGSTITFATSATNLTAEAQANPTCALQVVAYTVATDTTSVVSRATNAGVVLGAEGDSDSDSLGSMSADGSRIVFSSTAGNLTADTPPPQNPVVEQIFLRDRTTGTTTLVSRATGATGTGGNEGSSHPTISLDGHLVAFSSESSNLGVAAVGGPAAPENVFTRNLTTNATTVVSTQGAGNVPSTSASSPVLSGDGSTVAYESEDPTFNGGTPEQVVVRDLASGTNTIASRASGVSGTLGDRPSTDIALNSDGSVIAFESLAITLTPDTPQLQSAAALAFVRGAAPPLPVPTASPTATPAATPTATVAAIGVIGPPNTGGGPAEADWSRWWGFLLLAALAAPPAGLILLRQRQGRP